MGISRTNYGVLGALLFIVGAVVGGVAVYKGTSSFSDVVSFGPPTTIVQISTAYPITSLAIFIAGATFSAGASIFIYLLQPVAKDKSEIPPTSSAPSTPYAGTVGNSANKDEEYEVPAKHAKRKPVLNEETRKLVGEVLDASGQSAKVFGAILVLIGLLYLLAHVAGIWLIGTGLAFLILSAYKRKRPPTQDKFYPSLFAWSIEIIVMGLAFYAADFQYFLNLQEVAVASYYALLGIGVAILFAALQDYGLHKSQDAIVARMNQFEENIERYREEDREDWGDEDD